MFLVFSAPILLIAFLSAAYLIISGEDELHKYVLSALNYEIFSLTLELWLEILPLFISIFLSFSFLATYCCNIYSCYRKKTSQNPRFRLWTFPVVVEGPFGVVSAAELLGILLFSVYVLWAVYTYTMQILSSMSDQLPLKLKRWNYHTFLYSSSFLLLGNWDLVAFLSIVTADVTLRILCVSCHFSWTIFLVSSKALILASKNPL